MAKNEAPAFAPGEEDDRNPSAPSLCDICVMVVDPDRPDLLEGAEYRCACGNLLMCDAHAKAHVASKNPEVHVLVGADEGMCRVHRQLLVVYCCQDERPVCEQCLDSTHHGHTTTTIKRAEAERRRNLEADLAVLDALIANLTRGQQEASIAASAADERMDVLTRQITCSFEAILRGLSERMDALIREVRETLGPAASQDRQFAVLASRLQHLREQSLVLLETSGGSEKLSAARLEIQRALRQPLPPVIFTAPTLEFSFRGEGFAPDSLGSLKPAAGMPHPRLSILGTYQAGRVPVSFRDSDNQSLTLSESSLIDHLSLELQTQEDAKCTWVSHEGHVNIVIDGLRLGESAVLSVRWDGQHVTGSPMSLMSRRKRWADELKGESVAAWHLPSDNGQLALPYGITLWKDLVYTSEFRSHCVHVYDTAGTLLRTFGSRGSAEGELNCPLRLCVDSDEVFVCDYNNNRICVFEATTGAFLRQWGSYNAHCDVGQLRAPTGVCVFENEVYVVDRDGSSVCVFSREGRLLRTWGSEGTGPGQFSGPGNWKDITASRGSVCVRQRQ